MSAVAGVAVGKKAAHPRRMYNAAAKAARGYAETPRDEPARLMTPHGSVEYLPDPMVQAHRGLMADKRRFGAYIASRQRPIFWRWLAFGAAAEVVGMVVAGLALSIAQHVW